MLKSTPGAPLISDRGVTLTWDPTQVTEVCGVAVINYTPPEDYVAVPRGRLPKSAILLTQWEELNRALASTAALVDLMWWRTSETLNVPLAGELDALGTALDHDLSGNSGLPPDDIRDGWDRLQRRHPDFRYGSSEDHKYAAVVAAIVGEVHDHDPEWGSPQTPTTYLYIAEALERMSRETRILFGQKVFERSWKASRATRPRHFAMGDDHGGVIVFVSTAEPRADRVRFLQLLVAMLHSKTIETGQNRAKGTVGVATEAYPDSGGSHDFMLLAGELPLGASDKADRDEFLRQTVGEPRPVDMGAVEDLQADVAARAAWVEV